MLITHDGPVEVYVYVEGGKVQGVRASSPKALALEVFDVDNLLAEGRSRDEIELLWKELTEGTKPVW